MTEPTTEQLLHLVDRAADGRLLPAEADQLRDGVRRLQLATAPTVVDRLARERDLAAAKADASRTPETRAAHSGMAAGYDHASQIAAAALDKEPAT